MPRNANNTINPGNKYELFYWDGNWVSMGQKIATSDTLTYQVPEGGLFWLRNLAGGKEERIFTYKDGKQVWW